MLAAVLVALAAFPSQADAARPNIVVITTDDQTLASLRADTMPQRHAAARGKGHDVHGRDRHDAPLLSLPGDLDTGQYAHNHGVTSNRPGYAALELKDNTLPVWLDQAGYKTAHVGKHLNGYESAVAEATEVAPGWDIWFTTLGTTRYYDYDVSANGREVHFRGRDNDHVTRVINRRAQTLIRSKTPLKAPLYLQVDQRAPHTETKVDSGGRCGGRAIPDRAHTKLFRDELLPQPPSFNEADVSDIHPVTPAARAATLKGLTKRWGCSLASLPAVDRGVEWIVKAFKETDELRKTVIVFTSDNGYYYGEHRIPMGKIYPYEEGIRVPLVMRVPGQCRGGGDRIAQIAAPVGNIDLATTVLELARREAV